MHSHAFSYREMRVMYNLFMDVPVCVRENKSSHALHRLFPRFRRAAESKEVDQMESALFASMLLFILIFFG